MKHKIKCNTQKFLCTVLAICLLFTGLITGVSSIKVNATGNYGLASNIQDGVILHCFDWRYNDIKAELPNIAAAGFTTVQTSPAQPSANSGTWYWLYQPLGFYVGSNPLGTKDDLQSLCQEADKYGIKVVVDVVANHLAGDHSNIQGDLKDSQYWHTYGTVSNWADRYQVTHGEIGMPDLNSEHGYIQNVVSNYINELKNIGVDGIRWDAAKHIGLPSEGCNFWPSVTSQGLYHYGEILVGPDDRGSGNEGLMKEYTNYMTVTDSTYGKILRDSFSSGTAPTSFGNWSARGISNNKLIYWGESHDTWSNNQDWGYSNGMSQNVIDRAYAVAASRNSITALYFSRPYSSNKESIQAGQKGSTHFTSPEIAAVNHFHNAMIGQPDYYTTGSNCSVICRQGGAVIVAGSGGNFNVTVPNGGSTTKPGTYKDEITGETWTVTSSTISGKIGSSGIAVIYDGSSSGSISNPGSSSQQGTETTGTVYYKNTNNWSNVYAYYWSDSNTKMPTWPGVPMTSVGDNTYSINVSGATKIIFNDGSGQQTNNIALAGANKIYDNGSWSDYDNNQSATEPTESTTPQNPQGSDNVYYKNTNNWSQVYAYYWSDSNTKMTSWPGVQMSNMGDNTYSIKIPSDATKIIFNNGGDSKTNDLNIPGMNKIYNNGAWSSYGNNPSTTYPTEEQGTETTGAVYFKNTNNWSNVYAYYWSDSNTKMTAWPGVPMTSVGDNTYSINVSGATKIIFNDGSGQQTNNIALAGANKIYDNGSWSDYDNNQSATEPTETTTPQNPQGRDNVYYKNTNNWSNVYAYYWSDSNTKMTTWPGVQMSNVGDNTYSIKIPSDAAKIIFNNGGDSKTNDLNIPGMNKIYNNGIWSNYGSGQPETQPGTQMTCSVYFRNTNNWNNVRAYYWSDSNKNMISWPGETMVNVGNNVYRIDVPSGATKIIFTNGNGSQTSDLIIAGMNKIYENGKWSKYLQ